jgi:hypothetical protein
MRGGRALLITSRAFGALRRLPGGLPRLGPAIIVRRQFQPAGQRRPRRLKMMSMPKIKVTFPVVELDDDEMTRIIRGRIENKLIVPDLDSDLNDADPGIESRDALASVRQGRP